MNIPEKILFCLTLMTGLMQPSLALTFDETVDGSPGAVGDSRDSLNFLPLDFGLNTWTGQLRCFESYPRAAAECFDNLVFALDEGQYVGSIRLTTRAFFTDEYRDFTGFGIGLTDYTGEGYPPTLETRHFSLVDHYMNLNGEPIDSLEVEDEIVLWHAGRRLREGNYGINFTSIGFSNNDVEHPNPGESGFDYQVALYVQDYEAVPEIDGAGAPLTLGFMTLLLAIRREQRRRSNTV